MTFLFVRLNKQLIETSCYQGYDIKGEEKPREILKFQERYID
jgi:hypothetical protein